MTRKIKKYGWHPDLPDHRDHLYSAPAAVMAKLPPRMDLRSLCPTVYDQADLGSCTANAIAGAVEFDLMKQNLNNFMPSRLFIYYNERVIEGTVASDSGAMLRDGIKTVAKQGVCSETEWPYDISQFAQRPADACYTDAATTRAVQYKRIVQNLIQMKSCLASGSPFVFGFTVYESFESPGVATTGIVPLPKIGEQVLGGHAVMAVGYDDGNQLFFVRNSWGGSWGLQGYFMMPYAYLTQRNLSSDFWTIRLVS